MCQHFPSSFFVLKSVTGLGLVFHGQSPFYILIIRDNRLSGILKFYKKLKKLLRKIQKPEYLQVMDYFR